MRLESGKAIDSDSSVPDLLIEKKALYNRLADLNETVKTLNATYSENAANKLNADNLNFEGIFLEMFNETYKKFQSMARHNDRDVVDPMYKLTRMASAQFEMLERAKEMDTKGAGRTQAELVTLINDRDTDLEEEDKETQSALSDYDQQNVGFENGIDEANIMGLENLGPVSEDDDE